MPHIHTEPGQHDLTTTAFIIRYDGDTPVAFLHRHKKLKILLPVGGHVELDETPWAAVLHEIEEESGYSLEQLKIMQPLERIKKMDGVKVHPVPLFLQTHEFKNGAGHFHSDIGFVFVANGAPINMPADGESSEIEWLTQQQVAHRASEMPADIAQIYDFCFTTVLPQWEQVGLDGYDK